MQQNYLLELDGKASGRFFGFTGGSMHGDVVTSNTPAGTDKHISSIRFEDITLACGTGMSKVFYDWIGTSFGSAGARKNGAIVHIDHTGKVDARIEFSDASVKSLVLPELNKSGGNKDAVLSIGISPETVRSRNDAKPVDQGVYTSALPKAWNISSFRLNIDRLNIDTAHVSEVSSISLGNTVMAEAVGSRGPERISGKSQYSNIVIKLPETYADGFYKWLDDTLVSGNRDERSGSLEFFAPASSKAYFAVDMANLGIISAATQNAMRTKSALPLTVNMYCEKLTFHAGAAAIM